MIRILLGVIALLTLVVVLLWGWQARTALKAERWEVEAEQQEQRAVTAEANTRSALDRFGALDRSIGKLGEDRQKADADLSRKLSNLMLIKPTPEDTRETIDCLDRPVPVELDHWLRSETPRVP